MTGARARIAGLVLIVACAAACREQGSITVHSLKFEGVNQVSKGALESALQTKRGSRLFWEKKSRFDRRAFDADLQRIVAFYNDRGFPDARVTSFDVKLNGAQDQVDITLQISEGEPVLVERIDFDGFSVLSASQLQSLRSGLPLTVDKPLDRQLALATRERAVNALRDRGYGYAEVVLDEQIVAPRRTRVVLSAAPGILTYFGPVEIVGPRSVSPRVVERQLTYKQGDLFKRSDMQKSQRRLYSLELFEFANVESREDRDAQPAELPTRVTVTEGKHRKMTFGVGYGTEEKARARIRWDHLNFFHGAQHLGAEAKWSSLEYGARLEYREPYFLSPHLSLNFDTQYWFGNEPVYSLHQIGGRMTLRHQSSPETFWSVSLIDEYQRSTITQEGLDDPSNRNKFISLGLNPVTGVSLGTVSSVAFDFGRNTTTNLLDASSGYVLSGHAEQAGSWLWGTFNYWAAAGEARYFHTVGHSVVLANKLRFGSIDPVNGLVTNVPFYKRFFLGGAASLRGWGRFEVSPLLNGEPVGGFSVVEGSTEVRFPLAGKWGAVLFLDAGNVWDNAWQFDVGDLRYAAGPGLRYLTPVGPLRIDLGYQLNPIPGLLVDGQPQSRQWRLHFSIGQSF